MKIRFRTNREACKQFKAEFIEVNNESEWRQLSQTDKRCLFNDWMDCIHKSGECTNKQYDNYYWLY